MVVKIGHKPTTSRFQVKCPNHFTVLPPLRKHIVMPDSSQVVFILHVAWSEVRAHCCVLYKDELGWIRSNAVVRSHLASPTCRGAMDFLRKWIDFKIFLLDLELEHEGANQGSASQPVRRNISLKLKAKSKSTSSLSSGKSKKKEGKSSERTKSGSSDGKCFSLLLLLLL